MVIRAKEKKIFKNISLRISLFFSKKNAQYNLCEYLSCSYHFSAGDFKGDKAEMS